MKNNDLKIDELDDLLIDDDSPISTYDSYDDIKDLFDDDFESHNDDSSDELKTRSSRYESLDDASLEEENHIAEKKTKKEKKKDKSKKLRLWQKILIVLISMGLAGGSTLGFLLYGPYPNFREWLITTAMTTMTHQYLATWFYSDKTIDKVLKQNYVLESGEGTDGSLVKFVDYSKQRVMYKNKFEKEILTKDEGNDLYKLININESGMRGYLLAIYDPSKVKITTATRMGSSGELLTTMAKNSGAVIAMNASGFEDPNYNSNGGRALGAVIKDGKIVSNYSKPGISGGIIGFDKNNTLILGKMSAEAALKKGIRDGIEFGPYLIVNGVPSFIKGNGGWGTAPRSAIGQRKDGIVLFLVMDGRDYAHGIDGVGMVELTELLMRYGAYNASNLDGGTSSGLVINNELVNKPINGSGQNQTRAIPDAWIVVK